MHTETNLVSGHGREFDGSGHVSARNMAIGAATPAMKLNRAVFFLPTSTVKTARIVRHEMTSGAAPREWRNMARLNQRYKFRRHEDQPEQMKTG